MNNSRPEPVLGAAVFFLDEKFVLHSLSGRTADGKEYQRAAQKHQSGGRVQ